MFPIFITISILLKETIGLDPHWFVKSHFKDFLPCFMTVHSHSLQISIIYSARNKHFSTFDRLLSKVLIGIFIPPIM